MARKAKKSLLERLLWCVVKYVLILVTTVFLLAGSEITYKFNPEKAKHTIWDRTKQVLNIAKQVKGIF